MAEPENIKQKKAAGKGARGIKPPKKITEKYLYNAGLAYLQRFPAATAHFRRVMMRRIDRSCTYHKEQEREACVALLDAAVENFTRLGLLNDDGYVRGMVNSLRRRGASKQAILAKLQQKGVKQPEILAALMVVDSEMEENPERMAALALARRKKIGPFRTGLANYNREMAAFARAGFSFELAQSVINLAPDEAREEVLTGRF